MKLTESMKQTPEWGPLIKARRKELGWSQAALGAVYGVSHAAVSDWESGKSDPPGEITWWLYTEGRNE